jgi:hypothetical protein
VGWPPVVLSPTARPRPSKDDPWHGWRALATEDGRLYFSNVEDGRSQWDLPAAWAPLLGQWQLVRQGGVSFWYNPVQRASAWVDPRRATNVFQAALDGNVTFLHTYLAAGGTLTVTDAATRSPVHFAAAGGCAEITRILIAGKAAVDAEDAEQNTPLFYACERGFSGAAEVLLQSKASVEHRNAPGRTALHVAALRGELDCMHILLQHEADPSVQSEDGLTPLELALQHGQSRIVSMLEARARRPSRRVHFQVGVVHPERFARRRSRPNLAGKEPKEVSRTPARRRRRCSAPDFVEIWGSIRRIFELYLPVVEDDSTN